MTNATQDYNAVQEINKKLTDLISEIMAYELECHDNDIRAELVELRDALDAAKHDNIERGALTIIENAEYDNQSYSAKNWVGGQCHASIV